MAMASRRLAMSLNHGLRAQKAIRSIKPKQALTRALATPVHSSTTQSTTLSNGFTVCSHWHAQSLPAIRSLTA
jgi:processing peptidase subunit beta